jgi:hypothetical protein
MIYQHQARGAEAVITNAIDVHADAELPTMAASGCHRAGRLTGRLLARCYRKAAARCGPTVASQDQPCCFPPYR